MTASFPAQILWLLHKDLLLIWRSRARTLSVLGFGLITLLIFSFAAGPDTDRLRSNASGYLWLAILLSSTLTISESYRAELQHRALEGLRLVPVYPGALFIGKSIANLLQLALLGLALVPATLALCDVAVREGMPALMGVLLLGAAGIAGPGTLYGLLAARIRSGEVLLPILMFPLLLPALLGAGRATELILTGNAMGDLRAWVWLLVAFDLTYWSLCGALYGRLLEE
jgi:heme exporter protein B